MRILLIDDDMSMLPVVKAAAHRGAVVEWVPFLADALRLMNLIRFDLVILDMFGTMLGSDVKQEIDKCNNANLVLTSGTASAVSLDRTFVPKHRLGLWVSAYVNDREKETKNG